MYIQIIQKVVDMVVVETAVMVHQPRVMQAQMALAVVAEEVEKLLPQVEQVDLVSSS